MNRKYKGITHIGHSTLSEQLVANLISFHSWAFLELGGWTNVYRGSMSPYGVDQSKLRLVDDPNYALGRVWESIPNWVWETGLDLSHQPISISGVYVNNNFYPSNVTGTFEHKISYPLGRVIFNSPLPSSSNVQVEYSYRYCSFYPCDVPWFREFSTLSLRLDHPHFNQVSKGVFDILSTNRVSLPCVIVEPVPRRVLRPYQLGGGQWVTQDVLYHIYSNNSWDANKIADILSMQKERTLYSFDKNRLFPNHFPLNFDGSLRSGAMMYPQMVDPTGQFFWKKIYTKDISLQESLKYSSLYSVIIRTSYEIDFWEI